MALKTQDEIEAALAVPYDGPTKEVNGFNYIPARETIKLMNDIFGPLGWSDEIVAVEAHPEDGIYVAAGKITVRFLDNDGIEQTVTRGDVGRSTAGASKEERETAERNHEPIPVVTRILKLHDTAAAAAATDFFSRAAKKFGPALGSNLYDKENQRTSYSGGTGSTGGNGTGSGGKGPSEKQMKILTGACGFTPEEVSQMPFAQWKKTLDDYFAAKAGAF